MGLQLLPRKQTPNVSAQRRTCSSIFYCWNRSFLLNELHPLTSYKGEKCVRVGVLGEFVHPHELPDSKGMLIPKNLQPKNYAGEEDLLGVGHNLMGSQIEVTQQLLNHPREG